MPVIECRIAVPGDLTELLPLVREFYAHFEFPWDEDRKCALLTRVLDDPGLGWVWVIAVNDRIAGYALVPTYFSVEFNGRVALLDEFLVSVQDRGRGVGKQLLEGITGGLASEKIPALRLEVDRRHPASSRLYAQLGFQPDGRETWTRRLTPASRSPAFSGQPA